MGRGAIQKVRFPILRSAAQTFVRDVRMGMGFPIKKYQEISINIGTYPILEGYPKIPKNKAKKSVDTS